MCWHGDHDLPDPIPHLKHNCDVVTKISSPHPICRIVLNLNWTCVTMRGSSDDVDPSPHLMICIAFGAFYPRGAKCRNVRHLSLPRVANLSRTATCVASTCISLAALRASSLPRWDSAAVRFVILSTSITWASGTLTH
jgi:hypothetical protein